MRSIAMRRPALLPEAQRASYRRKKEEFIGGAYKMTTLCVMRTEYEGEKTELGYRGCQDTKIYCAKGRLSINDYRYPVQRN
jgi:hypothetical protein